MPQVPNYPREAGCHRLGFKPSPRGEPGDICAGQEGRVLGGGGVPVVWSAFLLGGLSFGNSSARSLLRSHFWSRTRARDIRYTALSGVEGKGSPGFEPELTPKLCSQPFGEDAGMA